MDQDALATLVAKEEIRELAMLYSRAVDRKDIELLGTLYTRDGYDRHGEYFSGSADAFVAWLAETLPRLPFSGHYICNHLISVDGDEGEGEVYVFAYHIVPDGNGGFSEDLQVIRYLDRYRKEDGRWRFARRDVAFDVRRVTPYTTPEHFQPAAGARDMSYEALSSRLFGRGPRA